MKLIKKILIILAVTFLVSSFMGTLYYLYQKSQTPPVIFETESPFVTDIIKKTVATGSINPRKEIQIKSQVSGVIDQIFVEPGATVTNNQKMAKIRIIPNVVALNNAEASVNRARINFVDARNELKRQEKLYSEKVISEYEFNQATLNFNLKKQELDAAENNLELVREGASKKSGSASNIVYSTVTGMVLDVPVKEGSFVIESNTFNEGTTIVSVADMSEMVFEGNVDESEVGKLEEGMELTINIGALDKQIFTATLEYISPKGVEQDGAIQFEIRAAVTLKKDVFLRAGYSANADIVLDKRSQVLAVKESNLILEKGKAFVDVETSPQQFERKQIEVGLSDGINIEIVSGLHPEEKIKKLVVVR